MVVIVLYVAGGASLLCWSIVLIAGVLYTRSGRIEPGPQSLEFGGAESPAVVNLMVNGWRLGHDAIAGTLIDLAARKIVVFDQIGPEDTVIRVPREQPPMLRTYERAVLTQLMQLAKDGVVPAAALVRTNPGSLKDWWPEFRKQVIADAERQGLCRPRWSRAMRWVFVLVSLVPPVFASIIIFRSGGGAAGVFYPLVLWGVLYAIATARQVERETPRGRQVAAQWLGYREYLMADEQFRTKQPAAVTIWDRHFAYAATFGFAEAAVRALPLATSDENQAWVYDGRWHRVRIRYPRLWGWGRSPLRVGAHGLLRTGLGATGLYFLLRLQQSGFDFATVNSRRNKLQFGPWIYPVGTTITAIVLLIGLVNLFCAIAEPISYRERTGLVIRRRTYRKTNYAHLAVDHGTAKTRAYRFWPYFDAPHEGTHVRITAGRFLGYISAIEPHPV